MRTQITERNVTRRFQPRSLTASSFSSIICSKQSSSRCKTVTSSSLHTSSTERVGTCSIAPFLEAKMRLAGGPCNCRRCGVTVSKIRLLFISCTVSLSQFSRSVHFFGMLSVHDDDDVSFSNSTASKWTLADMQCCTPPYTLHTISQPHEPRSTRFVFAHSRTSFAWLPIVTMCTARNEQINAILSAVHEA